jgi:hypothetical protein
MLTLTNLYNIHTALFNVKARGLIKFKKEKKEKEKRVSQEIKARSADNC